MTLINYMPYITGAANNVHAGWYFLGQFSFLWAHSNILLYASQCSGVYVCCMYPSGVSVFCKRQSYVTMLINFFHPWGVLACASMPQ